MPGKVLVVDDEEMIAATTRLLLEAIGYNVMAACGGLDALEKVKEEPPDLILLDAMISDMDGWEFVDRLKGSAQSASIPVVLFTTLDPSVGRQMSCGRGAVDYLRKPFEPDDLIELVKHHTGGPAIAP